MDIIDRTLKGEGIEEYGIIDFDKCKIINPRLLPDDNIQSALFILMPYRYPAAIKDSYNMGFFARIPDYHRVFGKLAKRLIPALETAVGCKVYAFADHSPVYEKGGAASCGLGFIGKNSLLINHRYGSFVFVGCFLFTERLAPVVREVVGDCGNCSLCQKACPAGAIRGDGLSVDSCLSALSQKKRKSEGELELLHKTNTIWGCDICQSACPYNKEAEQAPLKGFQVGLLDDVTAELIASMDEDTYKKYAFSFREKKVIAQNFLTDDN